MNFNPDLSNNDNNKDMVPVENTVNQIIVKDNRDILSMSNLLNVTLSHIEDDKICRDEVNLLTQELNNNIYNMGIKELIEYLKVKIREREFHVDCIFKAYQFVQRTQLANEMLIGSERKERIIEAVDRTKVNRLLGMLNMNTQSESEG